jgi:Holliday junction DNA helicase RuvA
MIASVSGTTTHVGLDQAVVEVGGVGLQVRTTPGTAAALRVGTPARLFTSLVVREDSLTLYGFGAVAERELFEVVQTVSGVGPRLALAMLAVHPPEALRAALATGDVGALTKVPGVGKKGAERLVLELRDKIGALAGGPGGAEGGAAGAVAPPAGEPWREQVREALVGLGWSVKQADDAVGRVADGLGTNPPVAEALRAALRELGR